MSGLEGPDETGGRADAYFPRGAGAAILRALAAGERSVSELVAATGLSQPNVSNHLARLRCRGLVDSRREGRQVLYRLASAGLARLMLAHERPESPPAGAVESVAADFLEAALSMREEDAGRVVDVALASGVDWTELYLRVFEPALEEVGRRWERGELSVAAEHLITGIVLRLMHRVSLSLPLAPQPGAPSALVGCVEGELHIVGGRMAADFLLGQGWRVWYLNGNLPAEHLIEAVHRHLPDCVVLCITLAKHEEALRSTVERLLRWRGEQPLPLLVGGGRCFEELAPIEGLDLGGHDLPRIVADMQRRIEEIRDRGD